MIINAKNGAFYRIFNSGGSDFDVKAKTGAGIPRRPKFSLDFAVDGEVWVTGTVGDTIEGIYEYLDSQAPVRSGRFKIKKVVDGDGNTVVDPTAEHKIIALGGGKSAWYRIFNSGVHDIILGYSPGDPKILKNEQSFDFEVGYKREITVESEHIDKPIEGIYDFLGRER